MHAAADGVALGAAATTSHADVEIIVFLAIMLHKAPAAFGLVTFLLHEGIDRFVFGCLIGRNNEIVVLGNESGSTF